MMLRTLTAILVLTSSAMAGDGTAPQLIEVEVTILDVSAHLQIADARDISADKLEEAVRKAGESGVLEHLVRVRVSTLNGQEAQLQIGQRQPVVSGRMLTGRGETRPQVSNVYQTQETGALISLVPTIAEDDTILLRIEAEQSRLANEHEASADSEDVALPAVITYSLQTTAAIPNGRTVLVSGSQESSGDSDQRQTFVMVNATIVE